MTLLPLLSNAEIIQYIRELEERGDLRPGTDEYWVYASLFQLSPATFTRAMTALKKGIITTASIRTLTGITDAWVEWLIEEGQGGGTAQSVKERRTASAYIHSYFPVYVDANALYRKIRLRTKPVKHADGSFTLAEHEERRIMEADSQDPADLLVTPRYDLSRLDPLRIHSFREAVEIYFLAINRNEYLKSEIARVETLMREERANVINDTIYRQMEDLVDGIRSRTLFLHTPTTSIHTFRTSFLGWVATRKYRISKLSTIKDAVADFMRLASTRDKALLVGTGSTLHESRQESPASPGTKTYHVPGTYTFPLLPEVDLFDHPDFTRYAVDRFTLAPGTMEREWTRFRTLQYGLGSLSVYLSTTERTQRGIEGKIGATLHLLDQISDALAICQEVVKNELGRNKQLRRKEGGSPTGLLLVITYAR